MIGMNKLTDLNWKKISDEKPDINKKCLVLGHETYLNFFKLYRRYDDDKKYNPDFYEWRILDYRLSNQSAYIDVRNSDLWVYADINNLITLLPNSEIEKDYYDDDELMQKFTDR